MSYQIGQIRKSNNTTYLQDLDWIQYTGTQGGFPVAGYGTNVFYDYAIQLANDQNFNANNTYYLRFTLDRININDTRFPSYHGGTLASGDPRQMNIRLQLFKNVKENGEYQLGTYQVIESNIQVDPYIQNFNTPKFSFEIIFTPNDTYRYLTFILSRVQYDYVGDPDIHTLFPGPRKDINRDTIDLTDGGDLCTVSNILSTIASKDYVDKIGIQSRPGTLLCINKEAIRIGRSGTYEVNNGVPITFVGFVGPNGSNARNIDKFIFDYAWNG